MEELFKKKGIRYSKGSRTEKNKKPDFIFPSIEDYQNSESLDDKLTMLGVKTTCKDRWRQVLTEAEKISKKHLFTLQPKISSNQMEEMRDSNLQLVIPEPIHSTYTEEQCHSLWDLETFVSHIKKLQG